MTRARGPLLESCFEVRWVGCYNYMLFAFGKMGAMQLCHHHDRWVAKNRKLGFGGHVRSTKFDVDWERRCFALVVSSFDKLSLLSLILIVGNICLPVVLLRGDNDFGSRVAGESCGRP